MININKRLQTLGDIILEGKSTGIIDVGCDHALLDIYLLERNNNLKLVASDLRKAPLEKAKENIEKYSFSNKIKIKLSYGIDDLEDYIDTIVISGMGTDTIMDIFNKGKEYLNRVDRIVLSSNNRYYELRKYMMENGYYINKEKIVYSDKKYYIIIDFLKGKKKYSEKELYFGPYLLNNKDDLFYEYYGMIKEKRESVIDDIPDDTDNKKSLQDEIELLTSEL